MNRQFARFAWRAMRMLRSIGVLDPLRVTLHEKAFTLAQGPYRASPVEAVAQVDFVLRGPVGISDIHVEAQYGNCKFQVRPNNIYAWLKTPTGTLRSDTEIRYDPPDLEKKQARPTKFYHIDDYTLIHNRKYLTVSDIDINRRVIVRFKGAGKRKDTDTSTVRALCLVIRYRAPTALFHHQRTKRIILHQGVQA